MARELELKAVVPNPDALRARLGAAGATPGFRGPMSDRRYDRDRELRQRDEVLRVREYHHADGRIESIVGWKGPARRTEGGYKEREEIETAVTGGASPDALLRALGYRTVHVIDRLVEYWNLGQAVVRLERYPRMDLLVEVEGPPEAIERAVQVTGLDRDSFSAGSLAQFVREYESRGGRPAVSLAEMDERPPDWPPE